MYCVTAWCSVKLSGGSGLQYQPATTTVMVWRTRVSPGIFTSLSESCAVLSSVSGRVDRSNNKLTVYSETITRQSAQHCTTLQSKHREARQPQCGTLHTCVYPGSLSWVRDRSSGLSRLTDLLGTDGEVNTEHTPDQGGHVSKPGWKCHHFQ